VGVSLRGSGEDSMASSMFTPVAWDKYLGDLGFLKFWEVQVRDTMGVLSIVCLFVCKICSFHNYRVFVILTSEASCLGSSKVNNKMQGSVLAPDTRSRALTWTSLLFLLPAFLRQCRTAFIDHGPTMRYQHARSNRRSSHGAALEVDREDALDRLRLYDSGL
jgi:hypothetical protein